jgi:hypothetical protein
MIRRCFSSWLVEVSNSRAYIEVKTTSIDSNIYCFNNDDKFTSLCGARRFGFNDGI